MSKIKVDLSQYNSKFSLKNKIARFIWNICYVILFRPFSLRIFDNYRNNLLRIFGAKIGKGSIIYSNAIIWAPWNLEIGNYVCIGRNVDCYNQGYITIGDNTTISQKSYLCASSHDITDPKIKLVLKPITIADQVWIAADAFIGPGVNIGQGVVVAARSAIFKNVDPWIVIGGNPASYIKKRIINEL